MAACFSSCFGFGARFLLAQQHNSAAVGANRPILVVVIVGTKLNLRQIEWTRFNYFEIRQIEQLNVLPANQQQLILIVEILVPNDRVVNDVEAKVAFVLDDRLGLRESKRRKQNESEY